MAKKSIQIGDLILSTGLHGSNGLMSRGMKAIVNYEDKAPEDKWLAKQMDKRYGKLIGKKDSIRWFEALPLSGGAIVVAEPYVKFLRKPTKEDLAIAYTSANSFAKKDLLKLFPNLKEDNVVLRKQFEYDLSVYAGGLSLLQILETVDRDLTKVFPFLKNEELVGRIMKLRQGQRTSQMRKLLKPYLKKTGVGDFYPPEISKLSGAKRLEACKKIYQLAMEVNKE
jgi:hypothetical protein